MGPEELLLYVKTVLNCRVHQSAKVRQVGQGSGVFQRLNKSTNLLVVLKATKLDGSTPALSSLVTMKDPMARIRKVITFVFFREQVFPIHQKSLFSSLFLSFWTLLTIDLSCLTLHSHETRPHLSQAIK